MKKWIIGVVAIISMFVFIAINFTDYTIDSDAEGLLLSQGTTEIDPNFTPHDPFMGTIADIVKNDEGHPTSFTLSDGQTFGLVNAEDFEFKYEELNTLKVGNNVIVTPINDENAYIYVINEEGDHISDLNYALSLNTEHILLTYTQIAEQYGLNKDSIENGIGCFSLYESDPMMIILLKGQGDFLSHITYDDIQLQEAEVALIYQKDDILLISITSEELFNQLKPYYEAFLPSFNDTVKTLSIMEK